MKILDDLISVLNVEAELKDIRQGVFHTAVLTRNCGLAATLPKDVIRQETPWVAEPGFLLNKSISELIKMAYSDKILEAAIGMATINSMIKVDEARCEELNAGDLIAEKGAGKRVTIIGHFPFIPKLREIANTVWVVEKNPQEGDYAESSAEEYIPQSDVVGITGTAFTNHSIEGLLEMCRPQTYVVMLGDTTPLAPLLFDYGVNAISGTKVVDSEMVLNCVSQGATYRQIKGIRKLTLKK